MAKESKLQHGGEVDGELLMSGCDRAAAFQPFDTALDRIAPAVAIRVEAWRAALAHVAALAGRDDRPDPASAKVGEDTFMALDLIAGQVLGTGAGAPSQTWEGEGF